ncbi:peptidoglycan -binding protein [Bombella saccharophila]|uniref:Peptidoglycan -binding protein n=1 Tax=Bombella saccharophila TaxID=2967338 RepID=A0ABT3W8L9_9PROT|nr:peptidoglycan -binding protein [Bombella saccharophila]MCX5615158.1 peptidoglycan -binding protein [Bombella saccharophila]
MARRRRHLGAINAWPGYVDALSSLLMVVTFVLLVFILGQEFLSATIAQKERSLDSLRQDLTKLSEMLSLSEGKVQTLNKANQEQKQLIATLNTTLDEKQHAMAAMEAQSRAVEGAQLGSIATLSSQVTELTHQLQAIAAALEVEKKNEADKDAQLAALGQKLNIALANKVNQLQRYRSVFFGRLRDLLKDQPGIEIVGDRFVFRSEVLFPSGSAELTPAGRREILTLAHTFREVAATIPADIPWILRVDGHADRQPIHSTSTSNWELSAARAITVVKTLILNGIDPHHIAATAFSNYQPLDHGRSAEALARNRRIEFRLTDR